MPEMLDILSFDSAVKCSYNSLLLQEWQTKRWQQICERKILRKNENAFPPHSNHTIKEAGLFVSDKIYTRRLLLRKSLFLETLSHIHRTFRNKAVFRCWELMVQNVLHWKLPLRRFLKGWCREYTQNSLVIYCSRLLAENHDYSSFSEGL